MDDRERLRDLMMGDTSALPATVLGRLRRGLGAAWHGRSLRADADVAAFVRSVGQLKGVAMKAGQVMSYVDIALPGEVRDALAALQTHSPPMPFDTVRGVLRDDLGAAAEGLLQDMDVTPLAAASIGQVHKSRLDQDVAVKVQYPDIRRAIESDFRAARMGPALAGLVFPGARIGDLVAEARERILEECDYVHEARMQERFRACLRDDPVLWVPRVYQEHSAARVLTMEHADGAGFEAFLRSDPDQPTRDRIGEALFRFYVGTLFRHGLFNCDPHPGNYLFADGQVAVLDHGCTREFEPRTVQGLAELTRAMHADDDDVLRAALASTGFAPAATGRDFDTAKRFLQGFHGPMLDPGRRRIRLDDRMGMQEILAKKRRLMRIGVPAEFLFLLRIRFGLLAVLARLGAEADWCRLEQGFVEG